MEKLALTDAMPSVVEGKIDLERTQNVPLCVDLDGTLINTDLLYETFFAAVRTNPFILFVFPFWLIRGRAFLKRKLYESGPLQYNLLPYNKEIVDFLKEKREQGRTLVLATASNQQAAREVGDYLEVFDDVIGSTERRNLKGKNKRDELLKRFGKYDYLGDSAADVPLWESARRSLIATSHLNFAKKVESLAHVEKVFHKSSFSLLTLVRAIRVHQWVKNLLIFVPLVMAHKASQPELLLAALLGFFSFSFCASGVYLTNDLFDLESDRAHHLKKKRPLASGALSLVSGMLLTVALTLMAIGIAIFLPSQFFAVLIGYFLLTSCYSLGLKKLAVLDIVVLASLYTVRIFAGGMAVSVPVSQWLLAFSLFFFFSLACMKRFSELYILRKQKLGSVKGRGYHADDLEQIGSFGSASGYLAILVLALYISSEEVSLLYSHANVLWLLCPVILFWITRIWLLAHRGQVHEDPIVFAIRDKISYVVGTLSLLILILAR